MKKSVAYKKKRVKRIPSINIFTRKNKRSHVYLPIPYNWPSLSKDHQAVTIMNHCCYGFDGQIIVFCLSASAKLQNPKEASRHPALMGKCSTCSHILWPCQSTKWFVISPFQVVCEVWDSVAARKVLVEKRVEMKFNILKNIARMTRRLYVLIVSRVLEWIYTL